MTCQVHALGVFFKRQLYNSRLGQVRKKGNKSNLGAGSGNRTRSNRLETYDITIIRCPRLLSILINQNFQNFLHLLFPFFTGGDGQLLKKLRVPAGRAGNGHEVTIFYIQNALPKTAGQPYFALHAFGAVTLDAFIVGHNLFNSIRRIDAPVNGSKTS